MNVHAALRARSPVRLKIDDFLLLREIGAFDNIWRPELLDGELFGTPRPDDGGEPESDAYVRFKLTVEHYHRLVAAGAFARYPATELIDGEVYAMSPQYRQHGFVKDEMAYRLRQCLEAIGSPLGVATEQSVWISPTSEPQPDIIVTSARRGAGPIPIGSVALLCETSYTTIEFDLGPKADVYAAAGVPEYWVADVNGRVIHQFWAPHDGNYAEQRKRTFGMSIDSATIPQLIIETTDL